MLNRIMSIPVAAQSNAVGLRPLACWRCGLDFRRGHGCLSVASAVCCQVEASASSRSFFQDSPKDCDAST